VTDRQPFGLWTPRFYLSRLRRHYGTWLHEVDELWGLVGLVLFTMGRPGAVCRWMSDWDRRPGAGPWMLNNLSIALQIRGHHAEAARVGRHVLSLPQHDDSVQRFRLWAALDEALAGRCDTASAHVANTDPTLYDGYDKSLKSMLDIALAFGTNDAAAPPFDRATRTELASFLRTHRLNRTMRLAFKRTCRLIANRRRSLWPRLWGYAQRHPFQAAAAWVAGALVGLYFLSRWAASL
jgi:hypothetical protein